MSCDLKFTSVMMLKLVLPLSQFPDHKKRFIFIYIQFSSSDLSISLSLFFLVATCDTVYLWRQCLHPRGTDGLTVLEGYVFAL